MSKPSDSCQSVRLALLPMRRTTTELLSEPIFVLLCSCHIRSPERKSRVVKAHSFIGKRLLMGQTLPHCPHTWAGEVGILPLCPLPSSFTPYQMDAHFLRPFTLKNHRITTVLKTELLALNRKKPHSFPETSIISF